MSAEAVLEIFSILALITLFQIWYDDIVSAMHLLGWMIFIAYLDLTFHLGRLEVLYILSILFHHHQQLALIMKLYFLL